MPIEVTFDEDRRLLRVTVTGSWPTLPEIVAERSRLILAGMIRPGVVELVDARGVNKNIPNLSQMQAILHSISKPPDKRAIIVGSNVQMSAGRIAEVLDPKGLRVFREEQPALEWLFGDHPAQRGANRRDVCGTHVALHQRDVRHVRRVEGKPLGVVQPQPGIEGRGVPDHHRVRFDEDVDRHDALGLPGAGQGTGQQDERNQARDGAAPHLSAPPRIRL